MIRRLSMLIPLAIASVAVAAPIRYQAPPETAVLAAGPDVELAEAICSSCHSLDYITTQPPMGPQAPAFWAAAVRKMQTAYGSEISKEDADKIVAYLGAAYR